jgi:hypothetical protein
VASAGEILPDCCRYVGIVLAPIHAPPVPKRQRKEAIAKSQNQSQRPTKHNRATTYHPSLAWSSSTPSGTQDRQIPGGNGEWYVYGTQKSSTPARPKHQRHVQYYTLLAKASQRHFFISISLHTTPTPPRSPPHRSTAHQRHHRRPHSEP